jgi:hypothetical protein
LHEAEDRGGRPDPDRQREGSNCGEARLLEQHPKSEANILQHGAS